MCTGAIIVEQNGRAIHMNIDKKIVDNFIIWVRENPNSFICMPKGVGYTMATEKCEAFRKFMKGMEENELEEREGNND